MYGSKHIYCVWSVNYVWIKMFNSFSGRYSFGRSTPIITNPNVIPNLEIWFNADVANATNFGNNIPTNGGGVKTWTDRASLTHDANESVANRQPLWNASQANGYGTIRFDGSNDRLSVNPINSWAYSLSGVSLFVVAKSLALSGTPVITTTDQSGFRFRWNTYYEVGMAGGLAASTVAGDTTSYHSFALIFDGSQTDADTTVQNNKRLKFYYDKVQQSLTFTANVNAATASTGSNFYMGVGTTGTANYWNGEIAEILIFRRTITSSERVAVENYLDTHWGLA